MKYLIKLIGCLILVLSLNTKLYAFSCSNCGTGGGGGSVPSGPAGGSLSGTYPNPSLAPPYGHTSYTAHGITLGEGSSNLGVMALCGTGSFPFGQAAADPICSTLLLPNSATLGDLICATSANTIGSCPDVATGQVWASGGVGAAAGYTASPTISGANLVAGSVPNASLVTTPLTAASWASPGAIGGTTPAAGAFTILSSTAGSTTSAAFGASLNLSTLISSDCTISAIGAITCTKSSGNLFTSTTFGAALNLSTYAGVLGTSTTGAPTLAVTNFTGSFPALNGSALTSLNASNISSGTLGGTRLGQSSGLQQPVMPVGSSVVAAISATTTTGSITTPPPSLSGDYEIVFLILNNTTSNTFTPAAGWAALASCNTSGNGQQAQAFGHVTGVSEPSTVTPVTWTGAGTGFAWISTFRNTSGVDVCAAANAAATTSITGPGITAAATTDRVISIVANTELAAWGPPIASLAATLGAVIDSGQYNASATGQNFSEVSYPIASTTVAGFTFGGVSGATVNFQLGMTYATSTVAGPQGALTYDQTDGVLDSIVLLGSHCQLGTQCFSAVLPSNNTTNPTIGGIGGMDLVTGRIDNMLSWDGSNVQLGDPGQHNGTGTIATNQTLAATTHNITGTSGFIVTQTGNVGTTGGGLLQSYGGTVPTCSAATGTCKVLAPVNCTGSGAPFACCTGSGAGASCPLSNNNGGQILLTGGTADTALTLTFASSGLFHLMPTCLFQDASGSITPTLYSVGTTSTSSVITDFAAASGATLNYWCIGH